jgi:glycosyltransferase involved in cell wall biosynthesis
LVGEIYTANKKMILSAPLVSVLMTAYNRERYIAEAIESVLASSYRNFELIIVDDCSKDNTVEIARSFEAKDSRVKIYVNEKNLGDYPNRNKAASFAKGKYLKYLDSDDIIYPYSLSIFVEGIEKFPNAGYAFCYNGVQDNVSPFPYEIAHVEAYRRHFFKGGFFYAGPGGTIINREVFENLGCFSGLRYSGDMEMWMKMAKEHSTVVLQPGLIWWRVHPGQEFYFGNKLNDYVSLNYKVTQNALKDGCPLSNTELTIAQQNTKRLLGRNLFKLLFKGKIKNFYKILNETKYPMVSLLICWFPGNKIRKWIK